MKFSFYTSTSGLERFPESERFGVWRSTHKRLMQEDAEYRRDVRRWRARVVWISILFAIVMLFLGSTTVLSAARGRPAIILNVVCLGALIVGYAVYTVVAAFRMQEFMNERVGKALQ